MNIVFLFLLNATFLSGLSRCLLLIAARRYSFTGIGFAFTAFSRHRASGTPFALKLPDNCAYGKKET
jgi:hypothetical protein